MINEKNDFLIEPIDTALIVNNFITGIKSNYEVYLNELINKSKFVKDYKAPFILREDPKEQSHNESDVYNDNYELDFKLFVEPNYMKAKKFYSDSIIIDKTTGARIVCSSSNEGQGTGYFLFKLIRKNKEYIEMIDSTEEKCLDDEDKIIKQYIRNIKMNKNILYFIPFNLHFKNRETTAIEIEEITDAINNDYKYLIEFRNEKTNKDTYICFISNQYMIFLKSNRLCCELYDIVELKESPNYMKLSFRA